VAPAAGPADTAVWPYALVFGDGGLIYAGDARFDAAARRWGRAKPDGPARIRVPLDAAPRGYRAVEAPNATPACRARLTLYRPLFDGDLAFVAADVARAGLPGGRTDVSIFRYRGGRWTHFAYGSSAYGVPIL